MSTHIVPCVVCGEDAACCNDTHALGCGDGGCYDPGIKIEFCFEDCFRELHRRMLDRWRIYSEIMYKEYRISTGPLAAPKPPGGGDERPMSA